MRLGCGKKHKPVTPPELPGGTFSLRVPLTRPARPLRGPSAAQPLLLELQQKSARRLAQPGSAQVHRPTRKPASGAQRTAEAWPAARAAAASPSRAGARGHGGAERGGTAGAEARGRPGEGRGGRGGEARLPRGRPTASHLARARGSPRRSPVPTTQCAQLTELRGRAGGQAEGRKAGRSRGQPGGGGGFGPHLARPPRTTRRDRVRARRAPKESPPAPTRKRHSSPSPSAAEAAAAAAHGVPPRCGAAGGARAQTVDSRNRPAAAAATAEAAGTRAGGT